MQLTKKTIPNNTKEPDPSSEGYDSLGRKVRICPSCNGRVILKHG